MAGYLGIRQPEAGALLHPRNQALPESVLDAENVAIGQPEIRLRANMILRDMGVIDELAGHLHEPGRQGGQVLDRARLHAIFGDEPARRLTDGHEDEIDARRAQHRHDLGGIHVLGGAAAQVIQRLRPATVEQLLAKAVALEEGPHRGAGGFRHMHMQHRLPIFYIEWQGERTSMRADAIEPELQRLGGVRKL